MTGRCMKDLDIFSALNHSEREQIGDLALKRTYHKNEIIFHEGTEADSIYLIKTGRVKLYKVSEEGKEFTLDYLKAEDIFGEVTFFEDALHTMNAVAMENTFICSCTKELFVKLLNNPETSLKIVQYMVRKINAYTEHISRNTFRDVKSRVLGILCRLAESYGIQTNAGLTIAIDLTHQEIGNLVSASRVMVSNVLGELRKEHLIYTDGQRITLTTEGITLYQKQSS